MTIPHQIAGNDHLGPLVEGLTAERTVHNIIKVDHAGEHGAIGIYQGQIVVSRLLNPSLVPALKDLLRHEWEHFRVFDKHARARGVRKCRLFPLWRVGGVVLGVVTALLGKNGIGTCTSAVETVVVEHLKQQILYLRTVDSDLMSDIEAILVEELAHRDMGEEISRPGPFNRFLASAIRGCTETAIWASMRL